MVVIVLAIVHAGAGGEVVFGADPATGLGGATASLVTFLDATTLEVRTPSHGAGSAAVMVRETESSQASVLSGAYAYQGSSGGGGSGGGCSTQIITGPPTWHDVLAGAGWILVAFLVLVPRARPAARPVPVRVDRR